MRNYQCSGCGSNKLGYQKYVQSIMAVDIHSNGNISYGEPVVDYDDEIPTNQGYVCRKCGDHLCHTGEWLSTEQELRWYLTASPETLAEQQREFEEYVDEQVRIQQEKEEQYAEAYEMEKSEVN